MRKNGKLIGLLFAIVMIVSLFSMTVSASGTVVESGSLRAYDYTLYSDGELLITCKETLRIDLGNIWSSVRSQAKTVTIDISSWDNTSSKSYGIVTIDGSGCEATKLTLYSEVGYRTSFALLALQDFPKLSGENIVLPKNVTIKYFDLYSMAGIDSLDFADKYNPTSMAIYDCENLTDGTINISTLEQIGIVNASKLKTVDLTATKVYSVGFPDCAALTDIKLPSTVTNLYFDDMGSFKGCKSLKSLNLNVGAGYINANTFAESGLESLKLPAGSSYIGRDAFKDCKSLKSVYIPASMKTITSDAFSGCSVLTDVYFGGTEEEWKALKNTSTFGNARIHYNYEYEPAWWQNSVGWMYYGKTGDVVKGWHEIENSWYYFESISGYMQKDWQEINGSWYFLGGNGIMRTGWQQVGSTWYYFGNDGSMRKGWQQISGSWYYFGDSGSMKTGWQFVGQYWYYFGGNGVMRTGWQTIDGKTYYFKSSGAMAYYEYCDGYWLNSDGTWTYKYQAKWTKGSKGWWYGDASGWYAKSGSYTIDGKVYTFDENGYCLNP